MKFHVNTLIDSQTRRSETLNEEIGKKDSSKIRVELFKSHRIHIISLLEDRHKR